MEHTPTPWATGDSDWHIIVGPSTRFLELNSSRVTGGVTTRLSAVAGVFSSDNEAEDLANAAFIVRACNAHDELVAALESVADDVRAEGGYLTMQSMELVRAALAKVTPAKVTA